MRELLHGAVRGRALWSASPTNAARRPQSFPFLCSLFYIALSSTTSATARNDMPGNGAVRGALPCAAAGKSRGFKDRKVVAPVEPSPHAPASAPLSRRHGSRVDRASTELSGGGAGHAPGRASHGPRCERRRPSPRPPVRTAVVRHGGWRLGEQRRRWGAAGRERQG
jgi:hypothetical protein